MLSAQLHSPPFIPITTYPHVTRNFRIWHHLTFFIFASEMPKCSESCSSESCPKQCCADLPCDDYSGYEVYCRNKAAVVSITAQIILTNTAADTPITSAADVTTYVVKGSGAFINKHYILTSSLLTQIAPSLLVDNVRWPYRNATDGTVADGVGDGLEPEEVVKVSRILVTVRNLNGRQNPMKRSKKCNKDDYWDGHTVVYEGTLLLTDGSGGVALIYINPCSPWNACLPKIKSKCHPKLCLGQSRKLHIGDPIYSVGSSNGAIPQAFCYNSYLGTNYDDFGICKGVVKNNRFMDPSGWCAPELVNVDFDVYAPNIGSPLINRFGELVGVQAFGTVGRSFVGITGVGTDYARKPPSLGNGSVAYISEFSFRDAVKAVLELSKKRGNCGRNRLLDHLQSVGDLTGDFYKFLRGWIGINYQQFQPNNYDDYITPAGLATTRPGERNIALTSGTLTPYPGPPNKPLVGIRVETLARTTGGGAQYAGSTVAYLQIPGTTPAAPWNPAIHVDSNFYGTLLPEDVIVALCGNLPLGNASEQIAPSLLLSKLLPEDNLSMVIKRPSVTIATGVVNSDTHLNNLTSIIGQLLPEPASYDYFWAGISNVPIIGAPRTAVPNQYQLMYTGSFLTFKPAI